LPDDGIPLIQNSYTDSTNQHFMMMPSDVIYSYPVVSITSPFTGSVYTLGSDIQIEAYAEDFDGTISKVYFYHADTIIRTDTITPFTFLFENVAAGTYQISAVAVDDDNLLSTPASITITVINEGGSPCTIQENETGFCSLDGIIDNNHPGFTGEGFANTTNASGAGINWKVNILLAGTYTLAWRFANGSGSRTGKLIVNNQELIPEIIMSGTGSWTTWTMTSTPADLPAGEVEICLEATNSDGLANIDFLEISGNETIPVFCAPTGIETINVLNENYKIYPNPFYDFLNIKSLQNEGFESRLELFNNLGKLVISTFLATENYDIYLNDLPAGFYYLRITNRKHILTTKLIKK
jgi:hypothetical protein